MKKDMCLLVLISIGISAVFIFTQKSPGYMDAEYHTAMGYQLANSNGFHEPFLWNYLDSPTSIIHASHTYWMPLPSLLSALGFFVLGQKTFFSARLLFILITSLIPVVTYSVTMRLTNSRTGSFVGGLLSIFCGYYSSYSTIPDSFGVYMICGGLLFLLYFSILSTNQKSSRCIINWFLVGIITGLMHLSRTEGFIWFVGCSLFCMIISIVQKKKMSSIIVNLAGILIGYFLIMGFWYERNIQVFSSLFPFGNQSTFFVTEYDQLFSYRTANLNFSNWSNRSLINIIKPILQSMSVILGTLIGVQTMVFLSPLIIVGVYQNKKNVILAFFYLMLLMMVVLMGFIFPFAGMRGGYFHTSAAFQIIVIGLSISGSLRIAAIFKKRLNNKKVNVERFIHISMVILAILVTVFVSNQKLFGENFNLDSGWDKNQITFKYIDQVLLNLNISTDTVLAVSNPPGLFWETGRMAIITPFEGEQELVIAAKQYGVEYVILQPDHLASFNNIYFDSLHTKYLEHIGSYDYGVEIYKLKNQ